jgi:hypothetical protein
VKRGKRQKREAWHLVAEITAIIWLVFPGGCAHQGTAPPEVVRAFATSVRLGQWERAYALMSDDFRRRVPLARFQTEIEADRQTINADAGELSRQGFGPPVRAVVETRGGDHVTLVLDGGAWHLDEQPLAPFGQHSPRAALRTLVRSIEQRRYDIVLRLVPERHRSGVTEESLRLYWEGPGSSAHRRLLQILRTNLDTPIINLGTEAQMPYGASGRTDENHSATGANAEGEVRFLFENGVWKIDDAS